MTAAVKTSGSQTATVTTEHDLATVTDAGTYALNVDVANMTSGGTPDIVEIRVYTKTRSSDTERLLKTYTLVGAQTEASFETPARLSPHHVRYTLKQTQGTGRAFPWAVYNA